MPTAEATLTCPRCHTGFRITLREMTPGSSRQCPHCGTMIRFSGQDAGKVQQTLDQLEGSLGGDMKISVHMRQKQPKPWWKFW